VLRLAGSTPSHKDIILIKSPVLVSNAKFNLQALFGPFLYRRVTTEHTWSFKARVTIVAEVVHHEASAPSWYGDFPSSSGVQEGSGLLLVLDRIPTPWKNDRKGNYR